jgi:tellurite methyltransferase
MTYPLLRPHDRLIYRILRMGKGKMHSDQKRWDERYKGKSPSRGAGPRRFLKTHIHLLPRGRALDVAAGEGQNAVFLAQCGFDVEAVDISAVGLQKARALARSKSVKMKTIHADLEFFEIERERYDLIAVFDFLNRRLIPRIKKGLKKNGIVVYETYLLEQKSFKGGPQNPLYLLKPNELLRLFSGFRVLFYREGVFREPRKKGIASLIAQKG